MSTAMKTPETSNRKGKEAHVGTKTRTTELNPTTEKEARMGTKTRTTELNPATEKEAHVGTKTRATAPVQMMRSDVRPPDGERCIEEKTTMTDDCQNVPAEFPLGWRRISNNELHNHGEADGPYDWVIYETDRKVRLTYVILPPGLYMDESAEVIPFDGDPEDVDFLELIYASDSGRQVAFVEGNVESRMAKEIRYYELLDE
jgi:hypothetical protein